MKTRYFFTLALAALLAYVLAAGCTQNFDVFQPCSFGTKLCDGACVPVSDPEFGCGPTACSPCGAANATAVCADAQCGIEECLGSFQNCDGDAANGCEVDTESDLAQCGACGNPCSTPNAQAVCQGGDCTIGTCNPGFDDCDGLAENGCEANLQIDEENCNECFNDCPAFFTCQGGECVVGCEPGFEDCDGNPDNGCETQLGTEQDCGGCGDVCDLANASDSCTGGACVIDSCDDGFDDCNDMDADGCEANIDDSAMTCGGCNMPCPNGPNGTTVCDNGECALNCNANFGDCDGNVANGCETNITDTEAHCGACGDACTPQNGTGICLAGNCQIQGCNGAFEDCDGNPDNGCEANTSTSAAHCGMCGNDCTYPNAAGVCNNGMCSMGNCNAGFDDCNNSAADGCEVQIANDEDNCGGCGNVCNGAPNAAPACNGGNCGLSCNAGFGNCDGNAGNGCETSTSDSVSHCGACGRACVGTNVASRSCTAGVCDSTCSLGFANCTQPAAPANDNGCEANVAGNDDNCGGCGNSCTMLGAANDLECDLNVPGVQNQCGCSSNQECDSGGGGTCVTNMGNPNLGRCQCSGGTMCASGEVCNAANQCSCETNGGTACAAGETCCQTPGGCFNLSTDPQNCGGCGHECPAGFACDPAAGTPECRCDGADDCDAGTGGLFICSPTGRCVCGATTCAVGQRCLPSGQCG